MSIFGQPPGPGSNNSSGTGSISSGPASVYGRGDLQAAFNWLVNQPEHIRKQASDPDRLMTLYYRSSGRPEMIRAEYTRSESLRGETTRVETARIETEAPVSGQNFISDLRQINEAMRQFDGPQQGTVHTSSSHTTSQIHTTPFQQPLQPQPQYQAPAPTSSSPHSNSSQSSSYQTAPSAPQHPVSYTPYQPPVPAPGQYAAQYPVPHPPSYPQTQPGMNPANLPGRTQAVLAEVREKLNLSSDAEALNILVSLGYRSLKPLLG